jgi:hypothetical protein
MSKPAPLPSNDHYEDACDQAIIMCGGNMRGAIKALIMANEYLEHELRELQAAIAGGARTGLSKADDRAPDRRNG